MMALGVDEIKTSDFETGKEESMGLIDTPICEEASKQEGYFYTIEIEMPSSICPRIY